MTGFEIPADLCPAHRQHAMSWRDNSFDERNPGEWPAGRSAGRRFLLMDSRTPNAERVTEFEEKNRRQVELIVSICRSGRSPQCDRQAVAS